MEAYQEGQRLIKKQIDGNIYSKLKTEDSYFF